MRGLDLVLIAAAVMLAAGLLAVLTWLISSAYLDWVERRLAKRKGLYRQLVNELTTRDRTLLAPTIHQMSTLYDLDALEAVLEEQARTATGRPGWLLEVYDELGLEDKYIEKLRTARKWRDRAFAAELLGRVGSAKAVPALLETVQATQTEDADVREIALRALARIADPQAVGPLVVALANAEPWLAPRIADILARHGDVVVDPLLRLLHGSTSHPARAWAANVLGEVRAQRAFPALVRSLDDEDDEVRAKAAGALGRLGDPRAVPSLLEHLLTDSAPFVRTRVASALSQFADPEIVSRLVRALGDPAWWVRLRAVEALEQIGPTAEGPLLMALNDSDPEIRRRAAVSLERLGVSEALVERIEQDDRTEEAGITLRQLTGTGTRELAAELLQHPSARIRRVALAALRESGRSDLTPELEKVASGDADPALRVEALNLLQGLPAPGAVSLAASAVDDPIPEVRIAAIGLLGRVGDRRALGLLRSQLEDPRAEVRAAAIAALATRGGSSAETDVLRLLADPEPSVREAAVATAAQAELRSLVPALLERLTDDHEAVRRAAAVALGRMGDRSVVPALVAAFDHAPPDLRPALTHAVARLDPRALGELLTRVAHAEDPGSRRSLADMLGRIRSPDGWDQLTRLADDPSPEVRAAAVKSLGRTGRLFTPPPATLVATLARSLRDSSDTVRVRAIEVCARLCLEDHWRTLVAMLETDASPVVRERAALAIGLIRPPAGATALTAACHRPEPVEVRAAAALAAGAYDQSSMVALVLEMPDESALRQQLRHRIKEDSWFRLLSRSLPRTSEAELGAVAGGGKAEAEVSLAHGLRNVLDASERVRLITGLRTFQGEQSREALLQLVRSDPSAEVRVAALTAVAERLDPDELLTFGSRALGDPSILVRRTAVQLFGRVPPERAFPRLISELRESEDPTVFAAVAGLAQVHFDSFRNAGLSPRLPADRSTLVARVARYVRHPETASLLAALARHASPETREVVAEVWRHRPDAIEPAALELLTADPVPTVRRLAAGAAVAAGRYELLDRMTQDPEPDVRREVAMVVGLAAPVGPEGLLVLEHLESDAEMPVRAAAHVARLLQGQPVPLPPGLDPQVTAQAVREGADLGALRSAARTAPTDDRRLSAALALAMIQDEVAREVARSDPAPSVRHRVGGALELSLRPDRGDAV